MNATTTRIPTTAATQAERRSFAPASGPLAAPAPASAAAPISAPFAALPHDIAGDPRLTPVDVRVLLALLFYARSKAACWPSDATIGYRVGRSVSTVQRSLRRLQALGLVDRIPDESENNRTGRRIVLAWRGRSTPAAPMIDPLASPVTDEGRRERERERPEPAAGCGSPPPPAGDGGTEPDLATLHQWAEGTDPILRRIAERRLAELAAEAGATVKPVAVVEPISPPPAPAPPGIAGSTASATPLKPTGLPGRATDRPSQGIPKPGNAQAGRQDRGTRRGPGLAVPTPIVTALAAWLTRRAPCSTHGPGREQCPQFAGGLGDDARRAAGSAWSRPPAVLPRSSALG